MRAENFTLQSFASYKTEFDAKLEDDPDFELWLFGDKQTICTMNKRLQSTSWHRGGPATGQRW